MKIGFVMEVSIKEEPVIRIFKMRLPALSPLFYFLIIHEEGISVLHDTHHCLTGV